MDSFTYSNAKYAIFSMLLKQTGFNLRLNNHWKTVKLKMQF